MEGAPAKSARVGQEAGQGEGGRRQTAGGVGPSVTGGSGPPAGALKSGKIFTIVTWHAT